ncbi:ADP-ribosylglycohydrolase family protein [Chryseolinea soli]|uniref:ADP-ribosylglycohydrolase family protein n=1 Tax=Chryseolinea soli TaxID=2321403 RepID=A0A385SGP4_9BACT|nr:ADP-ribosylglycohydrolase family protein [Chryseolinea soli]AYB30923.1 ADP-ribosylglycohydrolase family protein [Chryseolinea soli]
MKFENITSCFLGLAIGDALGVPVEFKGRSYFSNQPVRGMLGYGTWNQPPGTWSDDSSLTFCLAESLVAGYDLNDIGKKFVAWYSNGYWGAHHKLFDVGGTTRVALARIRDGEDPKFAGELDEDSNGNGSLMRIAPAPLYFCNETDEVLFERIKEISSVTHGHFRSVLSCFIFSKVMIELFKGEDKSSALQNAVEATKDFSHRSEFNVAELEKFDRVLSGKIQHVHANQISSSGYVLHTLEAALWCFLNTDSYRDAVLKAVNLGGDTDTTGCVAGALAGLYYGESSLPMEWTIALAREKDIIKLAGDFTESIKNKILDGKS